VSPLIDRLAVERVLLHVDSALVGDAEQPGGQFAALLIRHTDGPGRAPDAGYELAVIEANWSDTFLHAGRNRISPWVGVHAPRMGWELAKYHLRRTRGWFTLLLAVAIGVAVWCLEAGAVWGAAITFAVATVIALTAIVAFDFPRCPPDPNRLVRNLGGPVPDEHGEYFRNQQEFVPRLWRAIVPDSCWAAGALAQQRSQLLMNARLVLVAAIARARLMVLAMPAFAVVSLLVGRGFVDGRVYSQSVIDMVVDGVANAAGAVIGAGRVDAIADWLTQTFLAEVLIVVLLVVVAYQVTDVYANFMWAQLGRRLKPLFIEGQRLRVVPTVALVTLWMAAAGMLPELLLSRGVSFRTWLLYPAAVAGVLVLTLAWFYLPPGFRPETRWLHVPTLLVWAPTVVLPPLIASQFDAGLLVWGVLVGMNWLAAIAEITWFYGCLGAIERPVPKEMAVYACAIGRQQPSQTVQAHASYERTAL
jgi:hypothetical protein